MRVDGETWVAVEGEEVEDEEVVFEEAWGGMMANA